jgi:hypothetical protein
MPLKNRIRRYGRHACHICNETVNLQTAKTDENGKMVHEECYVQRILKIPWRKPPGSADYRSADYRSERELRNPPSKP